MLLNCGSSAASKAKLEYYQLTAFHDFRKTLQLYLKNADTIAKYFIDTNKVVLAGFSAGGILTINTLFLESNEMPLSITNLPAVLQSTYTANVRTQFYPIPKLKGAMAFTAGTFYPQIMENNYTKNIPLYLLHGTCDNLISQDVGLVPYKCNLQNPVLNTDSVTKYNTIYGSSWLFKKLLLNNYPVRYDQVCYGGHGTVPAITGDNNYGSFKDNTWDEYVPCPTLKPNPTIQERDKYNLQLAYWNANKHKNFTDPVESRIIDFCNSVFANPRTFVTKFSGFEAEGPENCAGDTSNIIPITNLTFSGQTCFGNATFPKYAQLTGGNESVLYYWKFGGNSNKVYTTFTPILMLDSIPKSVELSGCVTTTDFCKTINSCNRNITVIVVNGCDTLTFNHQSSISLCSGTCCPTCTVNMRLGKANTEEETESALSADINSMMAIGDRQLKIDIAQDSRGELYLYNMQGALVAKLNQQLLEGTNSILLDAGKLLPQGVYIAHYKDNENGILLSTKIVLQ